MQEWLLNLPVWQMAVILLAVAYLTAGATFSIIMALAKGERLPAFKNVTLGLVTSLGTIFGLLVVFIGAQVWSDMDRAQSAVDREASAIRMVVLLAPSFPGEQEAQIRNLVRRHIDEAVSVEWPAMAKQSASLKVASPALSEALQFTLSLAPGNNGQIAAQREIVTALESALDARRERIILSRARVNSTKWTCLFAESVCMMAAIAIVSSGNRAAAAIAVGIFATGVALAVLLIASHDRPFSGEISVKPDLLLQVRPD
jgi:hypothetical protein